MTIHTHDPSVPIIGYIIAALVILSALGGLGVMYLTWRREQPRFNMQGFRIRSFVKGERSVDLDLLGLKGLTEALHVLRVFVQEKYPLAAKSILAFWIDFYGPEDTITSFSVPTGEIWTNGTSQPITGTTDQLRVVPTSRIQTIVKVRRIVDVKYKTTNEGAVYVTSTPREAGRLALFHEVAAHVIPLVVLGSWNADHSNEQAKKDEIELRRRYQIEMGQGAAALEADKHHEH